MAAAGSPNPGKAGHVAIANATHLIAVGGMGALGALDAQSDTADILDLESNRWVRAGMRLDLDGVVINDHAATAAAPLAAGLSFVAGGARTTMNPATGEASQVTPIDQLAAIDSKTLKVTRIGATSANKTALGPVRGASMAYLFNFGAQLDPAAGVAASPALAIFGGATDTELATSTVRFLQLGSGPGPDLLAAKWNTPAHLTLPGLSVPATAYAAMAATADGTGAVVMGGFDSSGTVSAKTRMLMPVPKVAKTLAESLDPHSPDYPTVNAALKATVSASAQESTAARLTDGSTSSFWASGTMTDPSYSIDLGSAFNIHHLDITVYFLPDDALKDYESALFLVSAAPTVTGALAAGADTSMCTTTWTLDEFERHIIANCPEGTRGRYVHVTVRGPQKQLHNTYEVEVFTLIDWAWETIPDVEAIKQSLLVATSPSAASGGGPMVDGSLVTYLYASTVSGPSLTAKLELLRVRPVAAVKISKPSYCSTICQQSFPGMRVYVSNAEDMAGVDREADACSMPESDAAWFPAGDDSTIIECRGRAGRFVHMEWAAPVPSGKRVYMYLAEANVLVTKAGAPTARARAAASQFRGLALFFGGVGNSGQVINELSVFDTVSKSFLDSSAVAAIGSPPSGRSRVPIVQVGPNALGLFGGLDYTGARTRDFWKLLFDECDPLPTTQLVASQKEFFGVRYFACDASATVANGNDPVICSVDGRVTGLTPVCLGPVPSQPRGVTLAAGTKESTVLVSFYPPAEYDTPQKRSNLTGFYIVPKVQQESIERFAGKPVTGQTGLEVFEERGWTISQQQHLELRMGGENTTAVLTTTDAASCSVSLSRIGDGCPVMVWLAAAAPALAQGFEFEWKVSLDFKDGKWLPYQSQVFGVWLSEKSGGANSANWDIAVGLLRDYDDSVQVDGGAYELTDMVGMVIPVIWGRPDETGKAELLAYAASYEPFADYIVYAANVEIQDIDFYRIDWTIGCEVKLAASRPTMVCEYSFVEHKRIRFCNNLACSSHSEWAGGGWNAFTREPTYIGSSFGVYIDDYVPEADESNPINPILGIAFTNPADRPDQELGLAGVTVTSTSCSPVVGPKPLAVSPVDPSLSKYDVELGGVPNNFPVSVQVLASNVMGYGAPSELSNQATPKPKPDPGSQGAVLDSSEFFVTTSPADSASSSSFTPARLFSKTSGLASTTWTNPDSYPVVVTIDMVAQNLISTILVTADATMVNSRWFVSSFADTFASKQECTSDVPIGSRAGAVEYSFACAKARGRYIHITLLNVNAQLVRAAMNGLTVFGLPDPSNCPQRPTLASNAGLPSYLEVSGGCSSGQPGHSCVMKCVSSQTESFYPVSGADGATCNQGVWDAPELVCGQYCPALAAVPGLRKCTASLLRRGFDDSPSNNDVELRTGDFRYFESASSIYPLETLWSIHSGVLATNGLLRETCSQVHGVPVIFPDSDLEGRRSDVVVHARLQTDGAAGLLMRWKDEDNFIAVKLDTENQEITATAVVSGVESELLKTAVAFKLNGFEFHDLEVSTAGEVFTVSVNGAKQGTFEQSSLQAGYVGLMANFRRAAFDLIEVLADCSGVGCVSGSIEDSCSFTCAAGYTQVGATTTFCRGTYPEQPAWTDADISCRLNPPVVGNYTLSVAENSPEGTEIGPDRVTAVIDAADQQIAYGISTVYAVDPASGALTRMSQASQSIFAIDVCTGQMTVQRAVLDFEEQSRYVVAVRAFVASSSDVETLAFVTIRIIDVNEPPELLDQTLFIGEVAEGSTPTFGLRSRRKLLNGTLLAESGVVVVDPEANPLRFDIVPSGNRLVDSMFVIDALSGVISTVRPAVPESEYRGQFDFEQVGSHTITVRATELSTQEAHQASGRITIRASDLNDSPDIRASADSTSAWGRSFVMVSVADMAVSSSTYSSALFAPKLNVVDEDAVNGTYGKLPILLDVDSNLTSLDLDAIALEFDIDSGSEFAAAVYSNLGNTSLSYPTVDGTLTGAPIFRVDTETSQLGFATDPAPPGTDSFANRQPFYLRGRLVRQAYAVPVRARDQYGGEAVVPVIAVVTADISNSARIASVSIEGGNKTRLPTAGGAHVLFECRNVAAGSVVRASLAGNGREPIALQDKGGGEACSVTAANEIQCSSPEGSGAAWLWDVEVQSQGTNVWVRLSFDLLSQATVSFATPEVLTITGNSNLNTAGGALNLVVVTGTNLGPASASRSLRYGCSLRDSDGQRLADPPCKFWCTPVPGTGGHSSFQCVAGPSAGKDLDWVLDVNGQKATSDLREATRFAHAPPTVLSNNASLTDDGRLGVTTPSQATAGSANSDGYTIWTLDTSGTQKVLIQGSNFGPPGTAVRVLFGNEDATVGELNRCAHGAGALSHTQIVCETIPYAGKRHVLRVVIAGVESETTTDPDTQGLAYLPPVISKVSGPGATGSPTEGGANVFVTGYHFGPVDHSARLLLSVEYGPPTAPRRYRATNCAVISGPPSVSQIMCQTAPGTGRNHSWTVNVAGQEADAFVAGTSYAQPSIVRFEGQGSTDASTQGGQQVTIIGYNFGPGGGNYIFGQEDSFQVWYTAALDEGSPSATAITAEFSPSWCTILSHTAINCLSAAGAGDRLGWTVVIDSQRNSEPVTDYGPPEIDKILIHPGSSPSGVSPLPAAAAPASPAGGQYVEVTGKNFGPSNFRFTDRSVGSFLQSVKYGPTGTEYSPDFGLVGDGHNRLWFITEPGSGPLHRVTVVVGGQSSSPSAESFAFATPEVTGMDPASAPTFSSPSSPTTVTLTVKNAPIQDALSDLVVVFGNGVARTVFRPRPPVDLGGGVALVEFDLPTDGGGAFIPVRVGTVPAKAPAATLQLDELGNGPGVSEATPTTMFTFDPPTIKGASNSRPSFRGTPNETAECEAALFGSSFSQQGTPDKAAWDCSTVQKIVILGNNFGAHPDTLGRPDGIWRSVELADSVPATPSTAWRSDSLIVGDWDHTRVELYTMAKEGTIRLSLLSVGLNINNDQLETQTQSAQVAFREQSPMFSGMSSGIDMSNVPTTGSRATLDEAVHLLVRDLDPLAKRLVLFIGDVPARLLDPATGSLLPPPPTDPTNEQDPLWQAYGDAVLATISSQSRVQGGSAVWDVYGVVPPGQGAKVTVRLERFTGQQRLLSDEMFISYARPEIAQFQVVTDGTVSPAQDVLRAAAKIPTDGSGKVRVLGKNFGPCPLVRIEYFDAMYSAETYSDGAGGLVDCRPYLRDPAARLKGKVRPCPGSSPTEHTCLEFDTFEGEGDGTRLGLAGGFTVRVVTLGVAPDDGGTASVPETFRIEYAPARITSVTSASGSLPTQGGSSVLVAGANFGIFPNALRSTDSQLVDVTFGRDAASLVLKCLNVVRLSHSLLNCTLPAGSGRDLVGRVDVADIQGTVATKALSYSPPVIRSMSVVMDGVTTRRADAADSSFTIGGPTTGGYSLVLEGENFGAADVLGHCPFLSWPGRGSDSLSCGDTMAERERDSFIGQGKVSASSVLRYTHTLIELTVPPGLGRKDVLLYVAGNLLSAGGQQLPKFLYDAPFFSGNLSPRLAPTKGGLTMSIAGGNFGPTPAYVNSTASIPIEIANRLSLYYVRVTVQSPGCLNSDRTSCPCITNARVFGGSGRPARVEGCQIDSTMYQTHDEIRFSAPAGVGVGKQVNVELLDASLALDGERRFQPGMDFRAADPAVLSYEPPVIDLTNPQTVRMHGLADDSDAATRAVDILGSNFGNFELAIEQGWTAEEMRLAASIAGVPCKHTKRRREEGETVIQCDMGSTSVGYKNISLFVAGQAGFRGVFPRTRALNAVCDAGWFGRPGQSCLPCPEGGVCMGYVAEAVLVALGRQLQETDPMSQHTMPVPLPGWFNLNSSDSFGSQSMSGACPPAFAIEGRDVCIVPCSPQSSCLGENLCAPGYRSVAPEFRCASCDLSFYRRAGECVKCPDSPELLIIAFVVIAMGAAVAAYFMNKSNVDVALVQIGIDYFQVLAIFASARITWPQVVQDLFHLMSAFNLNLEITAPECLIPDIAFVTKWFIIMAIPVGCGVVLLFAWLAGLCYSKITRGSQWREANSHAGKIVAGYMIMLYFLYLYVSKQILDVFNCVPTSPPDGKLYLQAVFEPCDRPGGVHETLMFPALIALGAYTIGFPVFCFFITCTGGRKHVIMLDQLLRCYGVGYSATRTMTKAQQRAFEFRKAFNRLYYAFRPEFYFWILVLLARKFLVAMASLMFADAPDFQMAFVLLVLFVSYTMQVYFRPYLGRDEFSKVATSWKAAAQTASKQGRSATSIHYKIQGEFDSIALVNTDLERAVTAGQRSGEGSSLASAAVAGKEVRSSVNLLNGTLRNLMNYNTVATFLLASSILVCLAGVMFESGRLDRSGADASRDAVTIVTLVIIFLTGMYLAAVFVAEMLLVCNSSICFRATKGRGSRDFDPDRDAKMQVATKSIVSNPMMTQAGAAGSKADGGGSEADEQLRRDMAMLAHGPPTDPAAWQAFRGRFEEQARQLHSLSRDVTILRREQSTSAVAQRGRGRRSVFGTVGASKRLRSTALSAPSERSLAAMPGHEAREQPPRAAPAEPSSELESLKPERE
ncbi:hypothetical protein FNF28_00400 [Cafeteria roenbergensis]|uniref:Cadherin domain-containing protein n=1 Tax=Cafeteria roenbergensis TaxID=33653 RepID=A0A5A8E3Z6_CAFRO|nr:hypothetical protein FNF28_00400 [Cafeteria roenbergensis]